MDIDDLRVDNEYELGGEDDARQRGVHAEQVAELERKKRFRGMAVPTDDGKVRARLRAYGEPITLFGEGPGDRRDRLKHVQEQISAVKGEDTIMDGDESESDSDDEGEFYTEGSNDLLVARRSIARYSLSRAQRRIARQKIEVGLPLGKIVNVRKEVFKELKTFANLGSQFGDDRPLSTVRFSPNSQYLLTTSWTGQAKIWDLPNLNPISTKRGHAERIGGAAWHPQATLTQSAEGVNIATGGGEGEVKLWSLDGDKPLASMAGHSGRVGRVNFHPSGEYVGSAGFDGTWRLWDVQREKELLVQEGHSKEVYAMAFQDDGALAASGGFDAIGRVWDLRTGRTAMVLDGHVKEILAMDFAPNGYQVATGSGDDTVRIWDLRALRTQHIIPAHKSSVSEIKFFRAAGESLFSPLAHPEDTTGSGGVNGTDRTEGTEGTNGTIGTNGTEGIVAQADINMDSSVPISNPAPTPGVAASTAALPRSGLFLVTAGFDCNVRIWSADEWNLVRNLATDAGKVMSADVSADGRFIASASYSRSFHLFGGDRSL